MEKTAKPELHVVRRPKPKDEFDPSGPVADRADIKRVEKFIRQLSEAKFFGKVTISMQNGRIGQAQIEQMLKIDEM
jgi:hypothetical protein